MESITVLNLNLQYPNFATTMHAVQNDKLTRKVVAYLYDGSEQFTPSSGALAVVRYHKPDNTQGLYDVDEDGNTAVTWTGNVATINLTEQILACAGIVLCQVQFYTQGGERISTFTWRIDVQENAVTDEEIESTDYFSVLTAQISAALSITYRPPYINTTTGNWMVWSVNDNDYVDSGYSARGADGATGATGPAGPAGASMTGLTRISGTGAAGTTDTYQVDLSDGTTGGQFDVYNGADGTGSPGSATPLMDGIAAVGTATAYSREDHVHPSDTTKVDKVTGKGLSENDFTDALLTKLNGIASEATKNTASSTDPLMDGTASSGSATNYSRADHVHPTDTSKQDKNLYFTNKTAGTWSSDSTYSGYGYRCALSLSGVTASMYAEVVFGPTEALSGNYAPVCQTFAGGVYIYSKTNATIAIPTIIVLP